MSKRSIFFFVLFFVSGYLVFGQDISHAQYFAKAEALRTKGLFVEALTEYDRALSLDPFNPQYLYLKGYCALQLKDYDLAVAMLGQCLVQKPNHFLANKALIKVYSQLGNKSKQKEALEATLLIATNEDEKYEFYKELIALSFELDDFDKTLEYIDKAKLLNLGKSDLELSYVQASIFNSRGQYSQAIDLMNKSIELFKTKDPERTAKFYYELGYALHRMGRYQESIEVLKNANYGKFKALVAKFNPSYYLQAAICYMQINDYELSKTYLLKTLKMKPDYPAAYLNLGKIAEREADQSEAIEHYKRALQTEKNDQRIALLYENLAQLYLDNRLYDKAIQACDEYLKINPKNYTVLLQKAIAHYKKQNFPAAISILETISNITTLDEATRSKFYFALGVAYIHFEKNEDARRALKNVSSETFKSVAQVLLEELTLKTSSVLR